MFSASCPILRLRRITAHHRQTWPIGDWPLPVSHMQEADIKALPNASINWLRQPE